jgi:hypothetical protein
MVWMGVCLVFICGAIWGKVFPSGDFWSVKVTDVFGGISAVATAIAAYAAWQAAKTSKEQSEDSARQNRWQIYVSHYDLFNRHLDGMEKDFNIDFIRRNELYEKMFPNNRNIFIPFSPIGDDQVVIWHDEYRKLESLSRKQMLPNDQEICVWLSGCSWLAGQIQLSMLKDDELQFFLGDGVPTGINLENFENALPKIASVLERLSNFSCKNGSPIYNGMTWQMRNGIRSFINSVASGANVEHSYRRKS